MKPSLHTHIGLCLAAIAQLVIGGAAGRRSFTRTVRSVLRHLGANRTATTFRRPAP